ncbi:MAG TPA: PfkB family carbohydrate kinase, partial [Anaerolineae bacterium]|nr:PfkB family carbohydrate kinase [Anaerolineae bacterium]
MDIVCLGELLIDMFPAELGRSLIEVSAWQPKPGGAPANVAVAAQRLGAESAFIGKVGDDAFGHYLTGVLEHEGVDVRGMRYDSEARTAMAFVAKPDENSYDILFYRNPGADMRLQADELDRELLQSARALHFGSISLIQEPSRSATLEALRIARQAGALISFDVNYRPDLWSRDSARERVLATIPLVDLLKVNEIEVELLTGSGDPDTASKSLMALGPQLCVVTMGPDGSYFRVTGGGEYVPPFRVNTVDATGCGDAFIASLLCKLVLDADWREQLSVDRMRQILRYANAVGALTSLTQGAIPALPSTAQVNQFLAGQD